MKKLLISKISGVVGQFEEELGGGEIAVIKEPRSLIWTEETQ